MNAKNAPFPRDMIRGYPSFKVSKEASAPRQGFSLRSASSSRTQRYSEPGSRASSSALTDGSHGRRGR